MHPKTSIKMLKYIGESADPGNTGNHHQYMIVNQKLMVRVSFLEVVCTTSSLPVTQFRPAS